MNTAGKVGIVISVLAGLNIAGYYAHIKLRNKIINNTIDIIKQTEADEEDDQFSVIMIKEALIRQLTVGEGYRKAYLKKGLRINDDGSWEWLQKEATC